MSHPPLEERIAALAARVLTAAEPRRWLGTATRQSLSCVRRVFVPSLPVALAAPCCLRLRRPARRGRQRPEVDSGNARPHISRCSWSIATGGVAEYFGPHAKINGSDLALQIMRGTADGLNLLVCRVRSAHRGSGRRARSCRDVLRARGQASSGRSTTSRRRIAVSARRFRVRSLRGRQDRRSAAVPRRLGPEPTRGRARQRQP